MGKPRSPRRRPPKKVEEDRIFRVSLTKNDDDIKAFRRAYQGNWSCFVREALQEKIQREQLVTYAAPAPPQKPRKASSPSFLPRTALTAEEIRDGLLASIQGKGNEK